MKYNWPKIVDELRRVIGNTVRFYKEDGTPDENAQADFAFKLKNTCAFHPVGSDHLLSSALERMPKRCDYRSIRSYWAYKRGRERVAEAIDYCLEEMFSEIEDHYTTAWNFPPGFKLPHRISDDTFDWDLLDRKAVSRFKRLEKMRGPYMGDGINPGFTTTEVLEILRELVPTEVDTQEDPATIRP